VRSSARRSDDADVIRARLRALLADSRNRGGWVPTDEPDEFDEPDEPDEPDEFDEPDERDESAGGDQARNSSRPHREAGQEARGRRGGWPPDARARPAADPADRLPAALGRHRAPGLTARWDPGRPGAWVLWLVGLLTALGVVAWTVADRPVVDPAVDRIPAAARSGSPGAPPAAAPPAVSSAAVPPSAPASAGTVVVSVVGQVASPGLVTLPAGSRVADALAAAGGLLPGADPAAVNAAALLADGEQIAVGVPGAAAPPGATGGAGHTGLLDLNSATVADLDELPGIGPVLAQRIIDHRSANGPFTSVDQLQDVSGIGPAIYADLAQRVSV
jgi:comEA protein